ncbi:MAG: hypothetical protein WBN79_10110, partial [Gemmatimonadota bacterium]
LDEAERWDREEYIPRLAFDAETRELWDRASASRFQALRSGDLEAYERCCADRGPASDYLLLGDTLQAIEVLGARYLDRPRYNGGALHELWSPLLDGIRDDPRFQEVFEEILRYAGLEGTVLKRAPAGE